MSYLRYLYLPVNSGVQHKLCFVLFVFVLCTLCCQFLCIVLCFCFVCLRLVYPMLPVSLYCVVFLFCLSLSCVPYVLFVFVLCTLCCQFLWIFHFWFPLQFSLTFILCGIHNIHTNVMLTYIFMWNSQHPQTKVMLTYIFMWIHSIHKQKLHRPIYLCGNS